MSPGSSHASTLPNFCPLPSVHLSPVPAASDVLQFQIFLLRSCQGYGSLETWAVNLRGLDGSFRGLRPQGRT